MGAGDTLSSLAVRYGVAVGAIKRANGMLGEADLYLKDKIMYAASTTDTKLRKK